MCRRFVQICLLAAGLLATGSQWDFVQVVAWTRMTADNLRTMTLGEALEHAFISDKPCGLCRAVSKARQQQPGSLPSDEKLREKIVLMYETTPRQVATAAEPEGLPQSDWKPDGAERPAPPAPPPRAQA
jgi:hypothetical protein